MAAEPRTIVVEPESELDRLLDKAAESPLVLIRNEQRFRLEQESSDDIWAGYDPEASRRAILDAAGGGKESIDAEPELGRPSPDQVARSIAGIEQAAGSWKGLIDAEEFKAYIRERRRTKNRPSVRW